MFFLFSELWTFLTSPTFAVIAGITSIIPFSYAILKYLIKPLRIYYNEDSLRTLNAERAHLRRVTAEMDRLDKATYWEDLLYTPLEVEIKPFHLIPPEFMVLGSSKGDRKEKKRIGLPFEIGDEKQERYSDILTIFKKHKEPLIILGDPGAGKSVSFRHAVREMVKREMRWFKTKPLIPLYIPCGIYTETLNGTPLPLEEFIN